MSLGVIILAAGKGTRMRSGLAKVLHPLAGEPLLGHVLKAAHSVSADEIVVVHGHQAQQLQHVFRDQAVTWVLQAEQLGTGHAVLQAMQAVSACQQVMVLYADVPLIKADTLIALVNKLTMCDLAVLTASAKNPAGYGRIVRNKDGQFLEIVEQKDCTDRQLEIDEINSGILCIKEPLLAECLSNLSPDNAQGEFYLTDIVAMSVKAGRTVDSLHSDSLEEVSGVNDRQQLAHLERYYQIQRANHTMQSGVTITDPSRLDLRGEVAFGIDVTIEPNVLIQGPVSIGDRVVIGANNVIRNSVIGNDVSLKENCVIEDAVVGNNAFIGPFARLRPEAKLADNVHIGNFVEIKKSSVAKGSKINHLSYIGDCDIGEGVNIGAGTITCNYDGANKHKTIIGDHAFIGSDTQLIAPVTVGAGATIGAGSTITKDTPADKLTFSRAKQVTLPAWERPQKKGSS